ncbi:uncharacterized protein [Battus philenor]|uniref:uncharacterized protein n=1 Tax=Battus philenor TaxID=42288 RepID=UPI0035D01E3B
MAIGVDSSKWKPRKLKGTPAAKICNIIAISVLSFGIVWGAFYQYSSITKNVRKNLEILYEDPESEVERKQMIASGMPIRTGDMLRKLIEHEERPDLPYK